MGRFPHATPKLMTFGPFGNADPAASKEFTLFYTEYGPIEIVSAVVYNDAAIAANGSAYVVFTVESGATAAGGTTLFSANTSAAAVVAGKKYALTETEGTVAVSQYVTFTATEASTARMTDLTLELWYQDGTPASE